MLTFFKRRLTWAVAGNHRRWLSVVELPLVFISFAQKHIFSTQKCLRHWGGHRSFFNLFRSGHRSFSTYSDMRMLQSRTFVLSLLLSDPNRGVTHRQATVSNLPMSCCQHLWSLYIALPSQHDGSHFVLVLLFDLCLFFLFFFPFSRSIFNLYFFRSSPLSLRQCVTNVDEDHGFFIFWVLIFFNGGNNDGRVEMNIEEHWLMFWKMLMKDLMSNNFVELSWKEVIVVGGTMEVKREITK